MRITLIALPLVAAAALGAALLVPRLVDARPPTRSLRDLMASGAATPPAAPAPAAPAPASAPSTDPTPPPLAAPPVAPGVPMPAPPPPSASKAKIAFTEITWDWGTAPHGTVVRHVFRFKNEGVETLEILFARASCGCTVAQPSKNRFAPGETGEIEVAFDSAKKHLTQAKQRFANAVTVRTNDLSDASAGSPGSLRLMLEGDIVARYQLVPDAGLVFTTYARGAEPPTATVDVVPSTATLEGEAPAPPIVFAEATGGVPATANARILSAPASIDVLGVEAVVRDGRRGVAIRVRPKRSAPVGTLDGVLVISTGNPAQPELSIPVRGYVGPAVQIVPPRLILPLDLAGVARPVRIMAPGTPRVIGVEVRADGGGQAPLAADVQPAVAGSQGVMLNVREGPGLAALAQAKALGAAGELLVLLDSEEYPVVRVPYILRDLSRQPEEVQAQRAAGVRISPPELFLGEIPASGDIEGSLVAIKSGAAAAAIDVRQISVEPADLFDARVDTLKPNEVQRIMLRLKPRAPGSFFGRIHLRPREGAPELTLGACGTLLPRVEVEPAALVLTPGRRHAQVTLTRAGGGKVGVLTANDPQKRVAVETAPGDDGAVRVMVRLETAAAPVAGLRGEIVVLTDVPGAEQVVIPLLGVESK